MRSDDADSFRKARALVGLDRLEEARDALVDGLQFEPNDKVRFPCSCRYRADKSGAKYLPGRARCQDEGGRGIELLLSSPARRWQDKSYVLSPTSRARADFCTRMLVSCNRDTTKPSTAASSDHWVVIRLLTARVNPLNGSNKHLHSHYNFVSLIYLSTAHV